MVKGKIRICVGESALKYVGIRRTVIKIDIDAPDYAFNNSINAAESIINTLEHCLYDREPGRSLIYDDNQYPRTFIHSSPAPRLQYNP